MKIFTRFAIAVLLLFLEFNPIIGYSQIVINEITPSNNGSFTDEFNTNPDWVELYNAGSSAVNINGYGFSDNITVPLKWTFPDITMPSHSYLVVVTDDTSKKQITHHWECAVKASDTWKYKIPVAGADTNWRNLSFSDASWTSGTGGMGFGDNDDGTSIPLSSVCVYMRKSFTIADTGKITQAVFNMDYDDGFVAFLNGKEIARSNVGSIGIRPAYNLLASASHEALLYQGQNPDSFYLSKTFLATILVNGTNVLTVETHNNSTSSTDLSSNPFLSFGITDNGTYFSSLPSWFHAPAIEYMHAKFKLDKTGETVLLSNPAGTILDQKTYSNLEIDDSYGRSTDGASTWCYFETPTAASTNNLSTCASGYATIPLFSLTGNFYAVSQSLVLSTTQSGGVIRYSRDGTDPTSSSTQYSGPINLDTTQVIRARVFASGLLPSATITNDYFINETTKLPILSITTTPSNLWDWNTGIYVMGPNAGATSPYFGANFWMDWEKPATIEFFDKQKNRVFKFNANIKINGGYSRAKPQKSFEVKMDDKWGTSAINYALIPDKSFITNWDDWVIRNAGNDWHKAHMRDAALEKNLKNTNASYMGQEPCLGFVNGQFFGVYYIDENDDHNFVKNNYGYKKDEIDFLASNSGSVEIKQGSDSAFNAMYSYATTSSATGGSYYSTMNSKFDLLNFADYFIAEIYCGNSDWVGDWTNNVKLWRPRTTTGKFKFLTYDLDQSAGLNVTYSDNTLVRARRPNSANPFSGMFDKLLTNPQFKQYFINRYADLINTLFLPTNMLNQKNAIKDSINADMPRSFTKYGGSVSTWNTELSTFTSFINNRTSNCRNHAQTEFALTGQVALTLNVSPAGSGHIIISTISPATYPWTGVYFNGNPVTITAVPNPGFTFDHWKSTVAFPVNNTNQTVTQNFTAADPITAYFTGSAASTQITFSEVNYNSIAAADAGDWLELWNYGASSLDISAWYLKDENDNHKYTFPAGTVLAANGRLVLATEATKFQALFPSVTNFQSIDFGFENGGEIIRLYKYDGTIFKSLIYDNAVPWPTTPDGQGYTLELLSATGNLDDGANWFAGCAGGSPGVAYNAGACCSVTATITAGGSTTFCNGSSVTLNAASGAGYTYQWKKGGVNISGATLISYVANSTGAFTCSITSGTCSQVSNSIS
ncbi:MAG: CotH kinase family protein, partial [Bacteroidota bacterium]